jgi:WD40 repeat protein
MREPASDNLSGLDLDLVRRIDAVCRRFEADYRAGKSPVIADYVGEFPEVDRSALRSELIGLEQEMRRADEKSARPDSGPIADAPTIAPPNAPTAPIAGLGNPSVHEEATVPPRDAATVDLGTSAPPPDSLEPARVRYFGDYEIESELARGGMGVVFRARQISLNRPVALKMILAGQLANETDVKRFYTEAEAAANLDHPGIVPIYEVGQHEGQHYFSMGYVEGQSLSQRQADGPLPPREAAALLLKVAEAIEYAHSRGVIHRDLKPGNILLDRHGNPRVTDFGLAKRLQSDSGLTGSGQIMGTPSYMPPEQAGGNRGAVGPAADVYALGATLYALITGRPPFQAATPMDTVIQVIGDEPVPPRRLNASIPPDLETICLKCLEKEPGKRYATASALAEDLRRYLAGEPIVARPVTRLERAVKWARRRPAIAALSGLIALVTALGLGGVLWQWRAAVLARRDAERQTELAEQRLYDARMNLVQRYWEDYNGPLFQQGLDEQLPVNSGGTTWGGIDVIYSEEDVRELPARFNSGGTDRRGFEWFYWRRKLASGHVAIKSAVYSSVVFSPDGHRLAAGSYDVTVKDWTVKVWDAATGQVIHTLKGHSAPVTSVTFSPDGHRLAAGGGIPLSVAPLSAYRDGHRLASSGGIPNFPGEVKVWDAATGQETLTLKGHSGPVWSVTFSPDGHRLTSTGQDQTVKVWDAATGQVIHTLKGHTGIVLSVAFSPDGHRLASASDDRTVKAWDAATGQVIHTLTGHADRVTEVSFSPDGRRLASASRDGTVKVWDADTGQVIHTLAGQTSVAFSPDGHRLASAGRDGTVKVWDAATGDVIHTLKGHTNTAWISAFSADGRRIASFGVTGTNRPAIKVWDVATGQETLTLKGHSGNVNSVAFSPNRHQLASASGDATVKIWDATTGLEILTPKRHGGAVYGVAFSPDGHQLASASGDRMVKVWDAATGEVIHTLAGHTDRVVSVSFSLDGHRLASASRDGTVKVWDVDTGQETLTLKRHQGSVQGVAFSPDGQRIAAAGRDAVKVWDATTGQEIHALTHQWSPEDGVRSVAFSPDGHRLVSADYQLVKVWDAATGWKIHTFRGHTGNVTSVAFSPDGHRLASASVDQTVKVWDTGTGLETLTLKGHTNVVTSVAFSLDGHLLASASLDGTVKVWDARRLEPEPAQPGPTSR